MSNPITHRELLYAIFDGEATPEERAFFKQKLADCKHCKEWLESEKVFRTVLQECTDRHCPPQGLTQEIKTFASDFGKTV